MKRKAEMITRQVITTTRSRSKSWTANSFRSSTTPHQGNDKTNESTPTEMLKSSDNRRFPTIVPNKGLIRPDQSKATVPSIKDQTADVFKDLQVKEKVPSLSDPMQAAVIQGMFRLADMNLLIRDAITSLQPEVPPDDPDTDPSHSSEQLKRINMHFKDVSSVDAIISAFRNIESKISKEELGDESVKAAIQKMLNGPTDYGYTDLNNSQHLELLYHHISHIAKHLEDHEFPSQEGTMSKDEQWRTEKLLSPDPQKTYKTAFVGRGPSMAYYLQSLGVNIDPSELIILGLRQPWGNKRGMEVIPHPEHMITPERLFPESDKINDKWTKADHFAQKVEKVFEESGIEIQNEQVIKIEKVDRFYHISYGNKGDEKSIYAKDVILGTGSGEHSLGGLDEKQVAKTPDDVKAKKSRIMNMDIFNKVSDRLENSDARKETIVTIVGGSGGIFAAFDALKQGYKVKWIVGEEGAAFFPGQTAYAAYLPYLKCLSRQTNNQKEKNSYEDQIKDLENGTELDDLFQIQDQNIFHNVAEDFKKKKIEQVYFTFLESAEYKDNSVIATLKNGEKVETDYLVYVMGQDIRTFGILDKKIQDNLVPDYDLNGRFKPKDGTEPITLGLKTKDDPADGSLKIIGAAAYRIAPNIGVKHTTMKNVIESLPANVAFNDLLTPIRQQIEASLNYVPLNINEECNYTIDDATALAIHISAKYPTIADHKLEDGSSLADPLVDMIIKSRKQKGVKSELDLLPEGPDYLPVPPNGRRFQEHVENALKSLEENLQNNQKNTEAGSRASEKG